jgi:hypothetical protein
LPRRNPRLYSQRTVRLPAWLERLAAASSVAAMAGLVIVMVVGDLATMRDAGWGERLRQGRLSSIELLVVWAALGILLFGMAPRRKASQVAESLPVVEEPAS